VTESRAAANPAPPAAACANERVGRASAAKLRVRDAMVCTPKTLPADVAVGTLRALFDNPHVASALLVDGPRFVGAVARDQLPDSLPDDAPAAALANREIPTIEPDAPLTGALTALDARGDNRLVVVDLDGERLCGLLCLTRDRRGFCQS
jgi:CBS domain-containing protein